MKIAASRANAPVIRRFSGQRQKTLRRFITKVLNILRFRKLRKIPGLRAGLFLRRNTTRKYRPFGLYLLVQKLSSSETSHPISNFLNKIIFNFSSKLDDIGF